MKYAFLVGDGMADRPIPELDNKTPLEYAVTPNMDGVAAQGRVGLVQTVPEGMPPGSDVANLALLGYDPRECYGGRGPIEAASIGVKLEENDTAFRCNLVTLDGEIMKDYSAGHIGSEDSRPMIREIQDVLGSEVTAFHPGISYRHLTILKDFPTGLACTPPHDISGQPWEPHLPQGPGRERVLTLMEKARTILAYSDVNKKRMEQGLLPATDIWLWGQGRAMILKTIEQKFGIRGSVISAVDLVRGLGVLAGLRVRIVEGATGYLGTNYPGKVAAALEALKDEDFVYLHVEAPDETSHEGNLEKKIRAIEEFDRLVVGEFLKGAEGFRKDLRVLITPDHATPISTKTHNSDPVPFALHIPEMTPGSARTYSERSAAGSAVIPAAALFERFIRGTE